MNPLSVPQWGKKRKLENIPNAKNYLGIRSEVVRDDSKAEAYISVEVRGLKAMPSGAYRLALVEGQQLGKYLSRLKLKHAAIYSAVYDLEHGANRRLRMTYVPKEGSKIVIGTRSIGPATSLQRTSVDAQRVALNMGRGNKVAERKKR